MNESATPSVYPIRLEGDMGEHEPENEPSPADLMGPDPAPGLS